MSGFNNLFSVEPALPATQTYRMPDAVETWPEILMSRLREQYTDIAQLPIHVEFTKKDDESGSCVGSLKVVSPESGKTLLVPFIIHGFELKPLDIWMDASQKPHPMTPDTFAVEFFSTAIGSEEQPVPGNSQALNNPSTFHNVYPPITGKYAYASAGYNMLDSIADTMKKEDIENFKSQIDLKKTASTEHAEIFEKLSYHHGEVASTGIVSDLLKPGSLFVGASYKKITPDVYELVMGLDGVKDSARHYVNRDSLKKFLVGALGDDSEIKSKAIVKNKKVKDNSPFLFDYVKDQGQMVIATCQLSTQDGNDRQITGIAIPNIVGLDGTKRPTKKLFVSPFGYAYQSTMAGIISEVNEDTLSKLNLDTVPAPGATGVFVWAEDGKILSTIPVQIKTIVNSSEYHVKTEEGEDTVIKSNYSNEFYKEKPIEPLRNDTVPTERVSLQSLGFVKLPGRLGYRIPEGFVFITLPKKIFIPSMVKDYQEKIASTHLTPNVLEVKTYGADFWINGCGYDRETLSKEAFEVALMNLGAGEAETQNIVKHAEECGDMKLYAKRKLKKKEEHEKEEKEKSEKLEKAASEIKTDFVKIAASVAAVDADKPTMDVLLSLNFVNADNVARFAGYAPIFKQVADSLAELTIAARLGLPGIDENATTICMHKIVDLTSQLEALSIELEQPAEAARKANKKK